MTYQKMTLFLGGGGGGRGEGANVNKKLNSRNKKQI